MTTQRSTIEPLTLNNGLEMTALGLGVFQTPPDETRDAIRAALGAEYRRIDTAAAYGNERQVGEAVHSSEVARSEVFLETKVWISDYGYGETLHGFEKSAHKLPTTLSSRAGSFEPQQRLACPANHQGLLDRDGRARYRPPIPVEQRTSGSTPARPSTARTAD